MQRVSDYDQLRVEFETKGCTIPEDERARLQPQLEQLSDAVADFPATTLKVTVVHHVNSGVFRAHAKMRLPGESVTVGHASQWLDESLMSALSKTLLRVERYKDSPDEQAVREAKQQAQLTANLAAPTEPHAGEVGQAYQQQDYPAFRHALDVLEPDVREAVGRWVQRYPALQVLIGQAFNTEDLVEAVFLSAFDQYGDRPDQTPIRDWIRDLIDPAIKGLWHDPDERDAVNYAATLRTRPR